MTEDVPQWLEICKVIGAGIAFISVPALLVVWRQYVAERKDRADENKETLQILSKMLLTIDGMPATQREQYAGLIKAIEDLEDRLKEHITNHVKPGARRTTP